MLNDAGKTRHRIMCVTIQDCYMVALIWWEGMHLLFNRNNFIVQHIQCQITTIFEISVSKASLWLLVVALKRNIQSVINCFSFIWRASFVSLSIFGYDILKVQNIGFFKNLKQMSMGALHAWEVDLGGKMNNIWTDSVVIERDVKNSFMFFYHFTIISPRN